MIEEIKDLYQKFFTETIERKASKMLQFRIVGHFELTGKTFQLMVIYKRSNTRIMMW